MNHSSSNTDCDRTSLKVPARIILLCVLWRTTTRPTTTPALRCAAFERISFAFIIHCQRLAISSARYRSGRLSQPCTALTYPLPPVRFISWLSGLQALLHRAAPSSAQIRAGAVKEVRCADAPLLCELPGATHVSGTMLQPRSVCRCVCRSCDHQRSLYYLSSPWSSAL